MEATSCIDTGQRDTITLNRDFGAAFDQLALKQLHHLTPASSIYYRKLHITTVSTDFVAHLRYFDPLGQWAMNCAAQVCRFLAEAHRFQTLKARLH